MEALVAREDRLPVLRWLSDHEQHLSVGVHTDPSELERGKLWSQVRAEPVFKLVGLETASYAVRVTLLRADNQHGIAVEVPRSLLGAPVRCSEKELGDLRHALSAGQVESALGFQVVRLGLITNGKHMIQDAPLCALTERDDVDVHPRYLRPRSGLPQR